MTILSQLQRLTEQCTDNELRACIETMIVSAADYVAIVTQMEAACLNFSGRTGQDLRTVVGDADKKRHAAHDALITDVNIVNRICSLYQAEPVYTGSAARREYGDFAFRLVQELFENRS